MSLKGGRGPDKTPRKRRTEAELIAGIDPFVWLCKRFGYFIGEGNKTAGAEKAENWANADAMAFQLMPYIKPKLKQVDMALASSIEVNVKIGGIDEAPAEDGSQTEVDGEDPEAKPGEEDTEAKPGQESAPERATDAAEASAAPVPGNAENGGAKVDHGSGVMVALRAE